MCHFILLLTSHVQDSLEHLTSVASWDWVLFPSPPHAAPFGSLPALAVLTCSLRSPVDDAEGHRFSFPSSSRSSSPFLSAPPPSLLSSCLSASSLGFFQRLEWSQDWPKPRWGLQLLYMPHTPKCLRPHSLFLFSLDLLFSHPGMVSTCTQLSSSHSESPLLRSVLSFSSPPWLPPFPVDDCNCFLPGLPVEVLMLVSVLMALSDGPISVSLLLS